MPGKKEDKFLRVETAALKILAEEGPEKLTVSRLSRETGISRAWIYKQFGSDLHALLAFAAKSVGSRFAELEELPRFVDPGKCLDYFRERARKNLMDLEQAPWIPGIYFGQLGSSSPLGQAIREIEARYVEKTSRILRESLGFSRQRAQEKATALLKMRMAVAHSWVRDSAFRTQSKVEGAVTLMMAPLDVHC